MVRATVRWVLPAAGTIGAILAGATHASAANPVAATSTTPAGATTSSTLTWDVSPITGSVSCQLSWDDGSGTPALLGTSTACAWTHNSADPNQVAYAVPGRHAGKYALVVTTPSSGSATSTYVDVKPVAPVLTGPAGPSNNRQPSWAISGIDPEGAVTCSATSPQLASVSASCTPTPDATGHGTVSLDLSSAANDATITVAVTVTANGEGASAATSYALDITAPAPATLTPLASSGADRTPTFAVSNVEAAATVACTLTDPTGAAASLLLSACDATHAALNLSGAADGLYTLAVKVTDAAGNGSTSTATYMLLPPAPVAVVSPASPSAVRQPAWTLTDAAIGPVSYVCSASGPGGIAAPVSCAGGATVVLDTTALPDGTYAVTVRAVDQLGAAGDAATLTYLLVPPPPTAASAPASPSNSRTPQWGLTGDVAGVTYTCTATGPIAATVSCAGATAVLNLAGAVDGVYTISVLAVDALGHSSDASTPLRLHYQLDTTAPAPPVVDVTPSPSQGRTATYGISGVEPGGTVACAFSASAGVTVPAPTACGAEVTLDLTGQPDGAYVLTVTVTDVAGNASAATGATYVLDTTAPVAPIATIRSPGNDVTPTPALVVEQGVTLTCVIQKYFLAVATVPCGTDGTVDLSAWGDGEYEISLWATDDAGNVGPVSAPYSYLLDTVPPPTPVLTSPASPSPVVVPAWRWTGDPSTTGTCTVTNAGGVVVTGPVACTDLFTGDFSALPDGSYTVAVVVQDSAGNVSRPATSVFLLDRTAPVPPTVVPPTSPGNTYAPRWLITAPDGASLTCTLTRGRTVILGPGACPAGGLVSLQGMPDGTYAMRVTATDSAGNVSAASVTTYVLDTVAPASPTLDYGSPFAGTSRAPFWGFTLPIGATGRCELLSGGTVVAVHNDCRGAVSFTIGGTDGQYYVRIVAVDGAGNVSGPLVVGYQLYGHGGAGSGTTGGSGGSRLPRGNKLPPPGNVRRLIDHLGAAAGQAGKAVRRAAGGVASVLPSLPVIHDPLTNNVSHAVQNVINGLSKAGGGTGFPLMLLVIVGLFLMAQSRVDRRDPKLALASVAADDNLQFGPPPSRGDA